MATVILISAEDLTRNSILGGNIDVDRYLQDIKTCQNTKIKPLLGPALYTKISNDYESGGLTGSYLTLYEDYVKELIIHGSAEIYLAHGAYYVANNGITKMNSDSAQTVSKEEVDYLVQFSRNLYTSYLNEFFLWIKDNPLEEYKQNNVIKNNINVGGWFLRRDRYTNRCGYCNAYNGLNCQCYL